MYFILDIPQLRERFYFVFYSKSSIKRRKKDLNCFNYFLIVCNKKFNNFDKKINKCKIN